ncbi:MAG: glucosaminidase domain-containing protein [Saprospiraceae bacterium]|nr:glucosaminidase domain-containing protein [Saprospiraceae bacterium]
MKNDQYTDYSASGKKGPVTNRQQGVRRDYDYIALQDITLSMILKHIWLGILKIWVVLKYYFHRFTAGAFQGIRISWYKVGLAAFLLFIILKKDIQFSINMRAPGAASEVSNEQGDVRPVKLDANRFSVGDFFRLGNKKEISAPVVIEAGQARSYIRRFSRVAQVEMQKYGIPASIKMAQGLLESQAGQCKSAKNSNNHFPAQLGEHSYESAWESWRAHSQYLKTTFPDLFDLESSYKKWAKGLEKAGYVDSDDYSEQLVSLIEQYQLYLLDEQ